MFRTAIDRVLTSLPTRAALNFEFFWYHGRLPNLANPVTFNEKVQHRKLFDRDPRLPELTDKILAKEHVARVVGKEWVVPTLWHGTSLPPCHERIWPIPYVLKASHGCGWNLFVRESKDQKWSEIERTTDFWLGTTFGIPTNEWAYSSVQPRLLVEPYLDDIATTPNDYKFFVFDGKVHYVQVDTNRLKNHKQYFYDRHWSRQAIEYAAPATHDDIPAPSSFEQMVWAAEQLGATFPFVRVDMYEVAGIPQFGELTFYPNAARIRFKPKRIDTELGQLWPISQSLASS